MSKQEFLVGGWVRDSPAAIVALAHNMRDGLLENGSGGSAEMLAKGLAEIPGAVAEALFHGVCSVEGQTLVLEFRLVVTP